MTRERLRRAKAWRAPSRRATIDWLARRWSSGSSPRASSRWETGSPSIGNAHRRKRGRDMTRPTRGKALVTGAAGVMGARLVRALVGAGWDVRGLVLPGDPLRSRLEGCGCEIREGDV